LLRQANLNDLTLFLVGLRLSEDDRRADKATVAINAVEHALVRPDLNHSLASRGLDWQMELGLPFTRLEYEIGW
jgi:FKBP-type peptidyl-prolyl cis-trans isomerase 2